MDDPVDRLLPTGQSQPVGAISYEFLSDENFAHWHRRAVNFCNSQSSGRLLRRSLETFAALTVGDLPNARVVLALENAEILVGVSVAVASGKDCAFTVVRRNRRHLGIGKELLRRKVEVIPDYETLVAPDNPASLTMMFHCGLIATGLLDNGNGKQVLRFTSSRNLSGHLVAQASVASVPVLNAPFPIEERAVPACQPEASCPG